MLFSRDCRAQVAARGGGFELLAYIRGLCLYVGWGVVTRLPPCPRFP